MKLNFYKALISTFILLMAINAKAQIITTVAGNHIMGYIGDSGPATAAEFHYGAQVAFDGIGNLYINDAGNNVIRKINSSGTITTVAGNGMIGNSGDGGPATAAEFQSVGGIVVDGSGNIFITDFTANVIRKVNTSGIIRTIAGIGTNGYSGDGGSATAAMFYSPTGIVVDGSGNIYIADEHNYVIRKINASGIITTVVGNGTWGYSGDGDLATAAQLNDPSALTLDDFGNLFIADMDNNVIRKVNTSGIITTVAGNGMGGDTGDGGAATAAKLNSPIGIAVDGSGNLFIADRGNSRIREVHSGIITTVAGTGTAGYSGDGGVATAAELNWPTDVKIDGFGYLFIADTYNFVIRKVNIGSLNISQIISTNNNISILPSPNTGTFTIKGALSSLTVENVSLEVTDILGQVVYKSNTIAQNGILDVQIALENNLPDGMYLLHIKSESENDVSRFVIQK